MFKPSLFAFILLLAFRVSAQTPSCSPVDLRDRFGPIRNEGPRIGWCPAFSDADLIGEAEGVSPKTPLSALDVGGTFVTATTQQLLASGKSVHYAGKPYEKQELAQTDDFYLQRPENRNYGSGDLMAAMYLQQNRLCSEAASPSEKRPDDFGDLTLKQINRLAENVKPDRLTYIENRVIHLAHEKSPLSKPSCPHALPLDPDTAVALNEYASRQLKSSLDKECKGAPKFKKPLEVHTQVNVDETIGGQRDLANVLNAIISEKRPVSIGYNLCGFRTDGSVCLHESLVVGRRFDKGKCEFLIRNTHGPYCKQYQGMPAVECDKKTPGYFWVDGPSLTKQLAEITWIENDPKNFDKAKGAR